MNFPFGWQLGGLPAAPPEKGWGHSPSAGNVDTGGGAGPWGGPGKTGDINTPNIDPSKGGGRGVDGYAEPGEPLPGYGGPKGTVRDEHGSGPASGDPWGAAPGYGGNTGDVNTSSVDPVKHGSLGQGRDQNTQAPPDPVKGSRPVTVRGNPQPPEPAGGVTLIDRINQLHGVPHGLGRGGGGHGGGGGGGHGGGGGGGHGGGGGGGPHGGGGNFGRSAGGGNRYGWGWNGSAWGWGYWGSGDVYLYPVRTTCTAWSAPLQPDQITVALAQAAKASLAAGVTQASDGGTLFSFSLAPVAAPPGANSINAQQIIIRACTQFGVGGFADVNPQCTSNAWFTRDYNGDYWTGTGSEDSEARAYNANWVWNILQIGAAGEAGMLNGLGQLTPPPTPPLTPPSRGPVPTTSRGPGGGGGGGGGKHCNCGCTRCQHYAWTSEMRAIMDAQGLGHHPACPSVGVGQAPLPAIIVARGPVKQNPCDTRWQQDDYPPTEGPTDADTRCADAWWVQQVVPTGCGPQTQCNGSACCDPIQGVGSMQGISYGGRPVSVGVGRDIYTPPPPDPQRGPKPPLPGWLPGSSPTPVGPGNPIGPSTTYGRYAHRAPPPGFVWNTYRGAYTNPDQLRADTINAARVSDLLRAGATPPVKPPPDIYIPPPPDPGKTGGSGSGQWRRPPGEEPTGGIAGVGYYLLPEAPPPPPVTDHPGPTPPVVPPTKGWIPGSGPTPVGPGNPIGPTPPGEGYGRYAHRAPPPGFVWNTYRGAYTNPDQLRADTINAARVSDLLRAGATPPVKPPPDIYIPPPPDPGKTGGSGSGQWRPEPTGGIAGVGEVVPPARSGFLAGVPVLGLGAAANPSATAPATVGVVAALGGTVGLLVGAAVGSEIGSGYGDIATRRAAVGGLLGMLVGSFTGAAIVAPSVQAQGA